MTDVATGKANIQDTNDEYKRIFQELNDLFVANNMKNPNDFSDLWEFYNYWKKRGMKTYADRRSYIIKLYKRYLLLRERFYSFFEFFTLFIHILS